LLVAESGQGEVDGPVHEGRAQQVAIIREVHEGGRRVLSQPAPRLRGHGRWDHVVAASHAIPKRRSTGSYTGVRRRVGDEAGHDGRRHEPARLLPKQLNGHRTALRPTDQCHARDALPVDPPADASSSSRVRRPHVRGGRPRLVQLHPCPSVTDRRRCAKSRSDHAWRERREPRRPVRLVAGEAMHEHDQRLSGAGSDRLRPGDGVLVDPRRPAHPSQSAKRPATCSSDARYDLASPGWWSAVARAHDLGSTVRTRSV